MSVIVARPNGGGSSSSVIVVTTSGCFPAASVRTVCPPSISPSVLDSVPVADYRAVKWYVIEVTTSGSELRSYEIIATHRNGVSVAHTTYGILGDPATTTSVDVILAGTDLELQLVNSGVENVITYIVRVGVPVDGTVVAPTTTVDLTDYHFTATAGNSTVLDTGTPWNARGAMWTVVVSAADGRRESSHLISLNGISPTNQPAVAAQYMLVGNTTLQYTIEIRSTSDYGNPTYELDVTNNDTVNYKVDVTCIPNKVYENAVTSCKTIVSTTPTAPGVQIKAPTNVSIPAGNTVTVDSSIILPGIGTVHWLINAYDPISTNTATYEVIAGYGAIDGLYYTTYAAIADALNIITTPTIREGNLELDIQNNEASPLELTLVRVPVRCAL